MTSKLFIHGGRIWTGDAASPWAEAALVEDGTFTAVGKRRYVESKMEPRTTQSLDAGGSLVIPGITDAHMHLTAYCKQGLYLDLSGARSIGEMLDRIAARVEESGDRHCIRAVNYNETMWTEPVAPTMEMLDRVARGKALLVSRYCGHVHVANHIAIREGGLWESGDPNVMRGANGEPSGILNESAAAPILDMIKRECESSERLLALAEEGCRKLASMGITAVHACDVPSYGLPEEISVFQSLYEAGKLPLRVIAYHDRLPNLSFRSGLGNAFVSYGGFKLLVDGNLGGRTAAMRKDFSDKPGSKGQLNHTDAELIDLLCEAQARDIQVQIHMIGDAAIDQAIRAMQQLRAETGRAPKFPTRFNHVIVSPPDQASAMRKLGVVLDVQPIQAFTDRNMAPARLGGERMMYTYSFRRLYDAGFLMTGSSDGPMEDPNPWLGMWAAVCRTDGDGTPLKEAKPDEVLHLDEVLRLYTANPYRAIGWGDAYGRIAEGAKADFVVVEGNPFDNDRQRLRNVRVRNTFVEGTETYAASTSNR